MQIFEINGWMLAINQAITLARVWMEAHDCAIFKQVWEELQCLVKLLTTCPIGFKAIHKNGTLLGLNSDMEVALLLGFGDAFLLMIDWDELCGEKVDRFWCSGTPLLPQLCREDYQQIQNFKYSDSPQAVKVFKAWVMTLPNPTGELTGWWNHKLRPPIHPSPAL
ncbi:hypothetical protein B0H14DRAFT_2638513 [Mycena olivaceomarginata]|nr:hypothetical protein B0H14DRAFT_2638513 [Mycena olivaceomarginata]